MLPPVIEITSKKEITLIALIIFCMREIWIQAFAKATPVILGACLFSGFALLPLYLIGKSLQAQDQYLQNYYPDGEPRNGRTIGTIREFKRLDQQAIR